MNEPSNAPMIDSTTPQPEPFYQTWLKALTRPTEQTYVEIANSPSASARTGYLWLGISYIISFVISAAILQLSNGFQQGGGSGLSTSSVLAAIACGAPIGAVVGLLIYALEVAIVQWVAKMFKGTGSFDKLLYAFASFTAPLSLVSAVISFFSLIPFVGFCISLFGIVLAVYSAYLMITATKAVNGFGWGEAAGSVLIPTFALIFLCACLTIGILMLLGPVIGNVFSTINSSLGY